MSNTTFFNVPDGYEYSKNESTEDKIVLVKKKPKELRYKDVAKALFADKKGYYIGTSGKICELTFGWSHVLDPNNSVTKKQTQKLLALNKMMNVAKYLNGDGKPDWNNVDKHTYKWRIHIDKYNNFHYMPVDNPNVCVPLFKDRDACEQCRKILGDDTLKLALSSDF